MICIILEKKKTFMFSSFKLEIDFPFKNKLIIICIFLRLEILNFIKVCLFAIVEKFLVEEYFMSSLGDLLWKSCLNFVLQSDEKHGKQKPQSLNKASIQNDRKYFQKSNISIKVNICKILFKFTLLWQTYKVHKNIHYISFCTE